MVDEASTLEISLNTLCLDLVGLQKIAVLRELHEFISGHDIVLFKLLRYLKE